MIIFGSRIVHLKSEQLPITACASCNTQGALIMSVYRKHAHVFWIPLFPIGKEGVSVCQHCKNLLEENEMPDNIKRAYDEMKSDAKGPIWQFAGLGIVLFLFLIGLFG